VDECNDSASNFTPTSQRPGSLEAARSRL
jgi:hypothetical protein